MAPQNLDSPEPSTRQRLLDVAQRQFLDRGYNGVSVRDLTEAAGVNVASINYHFSGKQNLYREALALILGRTAKRLVKSVQDASAGQGRPELRAVLMAYVSTFLGELTASPDAQKMICLVTAEMSEDGIATDVLMKEVVAPVQAILKEQIMRARPDLSDRDAALCIVSIVGQVMHFVRAREVVSRVTGLAYTKEFIGHLATHITEFSLSAVMNLNAGHKTNIAPNGRRKTR